MVWGIRSMYAVTRKYGGKVQIHDGSVWVSVSQALHDTESCFFRSKTITAVRQRLVGGRVQKIQFQITFGTVVK